MLAAKRRSTPTCLKPELRSPTGSTAALVACLTYVRSTHDPGPANAQSEFQHRAICGPLCCAGALALDGCHLALHHSSSPAEASCFDGFHSGGGCVALLHHCIPVSIQRRRSSLWAVRLPPGADIMTVGAQVRSGPQAESTTQADLEGRPDLPHQLKIQQLVSIQAPVQHATSDR
jgi:hypothetical protein